MVILKNNFQQEFLKLKRKETSDTDIVNWIKSSKKNIDAGPQILKTNYSIPRKQAELFLKSETEKNGDFYIEGGFLYPDDIILEWLFQKNIVTFNFEKLETLFGEEKIFIVEVLALIFPNRDYLKHEIDSEFRFKKRTEIFRFNEISKLNHYKRSKKITNVNETRRADWYFQYQTFHSKLKKKLFLHDLKMIYKRKENI